MEKVTLKSPYVTINPPGKEITPESHSNDVGKVSFPDRISKGILSPYVEAYYNKKENILKVKAVVFVDLHPASNETFTYSIFQNSYVDIEGELQLQFFIAYDVPDKISKNFTIYEITFTAEPTIFQGKLSDVKTIQTFLWDVDPVTSRGTVTNVQDN